MRLNDWLGLVVTIVKHADEKATPTISIPEIMTITQAGSRATTYRRIAELRDAGFVLLPLSEKGWLIQHVPSWARRITNAR